MRYDISKQTAPAMPNLGKGTECIKFLLTQASKDMHEPLVPMLFPSLGAHINGAEFQYPDNTWKEVCGLMANIVADSGGKRANCHKSWRPSAAISVISPSSQPASNAQQPCLIDE